MSVLAVNSFGQSEDVNIKKELKAAQKAYNKNDHEQAIRSLEKIYQINPDDPDCLELLVDVYYDLDNYAQTKRYCTEFLIALNNKKTELQNINSSKSSANIDVVEALIIITESRLKWANNHLGIEETPPAQNEQGNIIDGNNDQTQVQGLKTEAESESMQSQSDVSENDMGKEGSEFVAFTSGDPAAQKQQLTQAVSNEFYNKLAAINNLDTINNTIDDCNGLIRNIEGYNSQLLLFYAPNTKQPAEHFAEMAVSIFKNALAEINKGKSYWFTEEKLNPAYADSIFPNQYYAVDYSWHLSGFRILKTAMLKLDNKSFLLLNIVFKTEGILMEDLITAQEEYMADSQSGNAPEVIIDDYAKEGEGSKEQPVGSEKGNIVVPVITDRDELKSEDRMYSIIENGMYSIYKANNVQWKLLEDNPSSYTVYQLFQKEEAWSLPGIGQLKILIEGILSHNSKGDNILLKLNWPHDEVVFISDEFEYDNRNNRIHQAILLDSDSYEIIGVQDGDEVYILVNSSK